MPEEKEERAELSLGAFLFGALSTAALAPLRFYPIQRAQRESVSSGRWHLV